MFNGVGTGPAEPKQEYRHERNTYEPMVRRCHNYGWPLVSLGRNYTGTLVSDEPWFRPGMDMPIYHWTPVINPANMLFYTGKEFVGLTNSLIIAGAGTKEVVQVSIKGRFVQPVDSMLHELNVRFRDIRQGPDENLYVLTEGRSRGNQDTDGMRLRLEPGPMKN